MVSDRGGRSALETPILPLVAWLIVRLTIRKGVSLKKTDSS